MLKIAVTTFYSPNYESLAALTIPPLQKWCDLHGYYLNINKINDGTKHHFIKTVDARELLNFYDIVFAIENDILLTNMRINIEDYVSNPAKHFYLTHDVNGANTGTFIACSSEACKQLLDILNNSRGNFGDEQNFFETTDINIVQQLPHPSINSIPYKYYHNYGYIKYNGELEPTHEQGNWQVGDFTMHLPGMTLERRCEIFANHLKDIIYE